MAYLRITNDRVGAMQNIKKQGFEHLRVFPHPLKVETLETREADSVLRVVKKESELPALFPFVKAGVQIAAKRVSQRTESMGIRVVRTVKGLNLFGQLPLLCANEGLALRLRT